MLLFEPAPKRPVPPLPNFPMSDDDTQEVEGEKSLIDVDDSQREEGELPEVNDVEEVVEKRSGSKVGERRSCIYI